MSWTVTPRYLGAAVSDADAQTYLRAVETADGQPLEQGVQQAVNQFVIGCKADGIWSAIKASCILAGARTLAGALVPLAGTAPTNFNFVAGDYNRKTGLVGDGSTKYLDSNRAGTADPQNNNHHCCYVSTAATSGAGSFPVYIGNSTGGTRVVYRDQNNGPLILAVNGANLTGVSGGSLGFMGGARSGAASVVFQVNGANTANSTTSVALNSDRLGIFAAAQTNRAITYSNARLAFYSIGESLNLALLDTRVTTLVNALSAAIP